MSAWSEMKERIDAQIKCADILTQHLEDELDEGDVVDTTMLLDSLATLGLELVPIADHNIASYAWLKELGYSLDKLISEAIEV